MSAIEKLLDLIELFRTDDGTVLVISGVGILISMIVIMSLMYLKKNNQK